MPENKTLGLSDSVTSIEIIELEIEPRIETDRKTVWGAMKTQLMAMSVCEVRKVANEIRGCTPHEAMELIVVGIAPVENEGLNDGGIHDPAPEQAAFSGDLTIKDDAH